MQQGTPIEIEWIDASLDTSEIPKDPQDYDPSSQKTKSIGYFVKKGPLNTIIATDFYPGNPDPFRGAQRIPNVLILAISELVVERTKKTLLQKHYK